MDLIRVTLNRPPNPEELIRTIYHKGVILAVRSDINLFNPYLIIANSDVSRTTEFSNPLDIEFDALAIAKINSNFRFKAPIDRGYGSFCDTIRNLEIEYAGNLKEIKNAVRSAGIPEEKPLGRINGTACYSTLSESEEFNYCGGNLIGRLNYTPDFVITDTASIMQSLRSILHQEVMRSELSERLRLQRENRNKETQTASA